MTYGASLSATGLSSFGSSQEVVSPADAASIPSAEFTAEDFLAWARTQPPTKKYDYDSINGCALCHYFHDRGIGFRAVAGSRWRDVRDVYHPIPVELDRALIASTYGELVKRIEQGTRW